MRIVPPIVPEYDPCREGIPPVPSEEEVGLSVDDDERVFGQRFTAWTPDVPVDVESRAF